MLTVQTNVAPEEIRQAAKHTLFVEGQGSDSFDPAVLGVLLNDLSGRVEPLGPCFHITSVAEALHQYHPTYYFLIDRDHRDRTFVDNSWRNFPDPKTKNLLVWRRRHVENYFIDPVYLGKCDYLNCPQTVLEDTVLRTAQARLFFDVANLVLISIREEAKATWLEPFRKKNEFKNADEAESRLVTMPDFVRRSRELIKLGGKRAIRKRFRTYLEEASGGIPRLKYGRGRWLEMLCGKEIYHSVASRCFKVVDSQGHVLQGKNARHEIAKDLVRKDLSAQPADFRELHRMLAERVNQ